MKEKDIIIFMRRTQENESRIAHAQINNQTVVEGMVAALTTPRLRMFGKVILGPLVKPELLQALVLSIQQSKRERASMAKNDEPIKP